MEVNATSTSGSDSGSDMDNLSTNHEGLVEKVEKKKAKKDRQKLKKIDEEGVKKRKGSPLSLSPPSKESRRKSLSGGLVPMNSNPKNDSKVTASPLNKTMLPNASSHHNENPPTLLQFKPAPTPRKITKENRTGL